MSIKKIITLFLLMMGFSFSANALYLLKSFSGTYNSNPPPYCGLTVGDTFSSSACIGTSFTNNGTTYTVTQVTYQTNTDILAACSSSKCYYVGYASNNKTCSSPKVLINGICSTIPECDAPSFLDPDTYECITPPVCDPPSQLDPDTNECITLPFCERDSTNDSLFEAESSCAAESGIFTFECSDFLESLTTRCTQSDHCALGFPNWPACMGDIDPTDDIDAPSSGFNGGSGNTINAEAPTFDKPEPDQVQTPIVDSTDEAVLEAVQNANRDSNEGFTALGTDINNFAAQNYNSLSQLDATTNAVGQSVVDQMNQDYEMFLANKTLMLQQTGQIATSSNLVAESVGAQTGSLVNAINTQTDSLNNSLSNLADSLGEQCEPTAENDYCESPHGLDESLIATTFTQVDAAGLAIINDGHSSIELVLQDVIDAPLTTETESIMSNSLDLVTGALGYNGTCSPLTLEANGKTYSIGCDVSEKIKLVLSFLIGIYTLMSLSDILLNGISPVGRSASSGRS